MGWQNYSTKYLSMIINLFVLWYPSAQILTNNYFYEALFKAQSNLITSERKIDKVRVCGESDYFSHLCTDDVTLNMTNPTSYLKESHRNQVLCIYAARHTETLNSQLEAELSTFVQGNPYLMPLSSLLWVFLAFTFSGRDASKRGCECSGWKDCTQVRGVHTGTWGGKENWGKASVLWFQFGFYFRVLNESNSYTILFTASSLFSDFFPQDLVWPRKLLKTSQISSKAGRQSPWTVAMKQAEAVTTFFGTSCLPVERWLSLLVRVLTAWMQGMAATP